MRKIMTLLLVALLAFSLIVTFAACNDDDGITKNDVEKGSSSESSSENTTENKNNSETTANTSSSETTGSNTSETTATGTQKPNLSPEQEDKEGVNFNPMRPL